MFLISWDFNDPFPNGIEATKEGKFSTFNFIHRLHGHGNEISSYGMKRRHAFSWQYVPRYRIKTGGGVNFTNHKKPILEQNVFDVMPI